MERDAIYDRNGNPVYRVLDNGRIVDFAGNNRGFIDARGNIYDYGGNYRGWYERGAIRDNSGDLVGFGENMNDSPRPILPIRKIKPIPGIVKIEPIRPIPAIPPIRPIKSLRWSETRLEDFL